MDIETLRDRLYEAVLRSAQVSGLPLSSGAESAIHHNLLLTLQESGLFAAVDEAAQTNESPQP